jgi:hypothetical protein
LQRLYGTTALGRDTISCVADAVLASRAAEDPRKAGDLVKPLRQLRDLVKFRR